LRRCSDQKRMFSVVNEISYADQCDGQVHDVLTGDEQKALGVLPSGQYCRIAGRNCDVQCRLSVFSSPITYHGIPRQLMTFTISRTCVRSLEEQYGSRRLRAMHYERTHDAAQAAHTTKRGCEVQHMQLIRPCITRLETMWAALETARRTPAMLKKWKFDPPLTTSLASLIGLLKRLLRASRR
jgi:hypothetical protein